ncbi:hypothetical protein [Desulfovibrio cuneatus]|uniref:hypothetical protein n=1 Tax=Desulfovibrio cuneatus TaxID=159728 RepID=UPI00041F77CD|nr:hypothetical protein [Desulfovibrio cuneatus]
MGTHSKGTEQIEALQQQQQFRVTRKRKCATCGKPTTDFRCEACWNKLRGMGQNGEVRKQKPMTNKMQADPWKPLTALPVAFVPDRQAEFFAKQEAKQKETAMNTPPERQRTYTMKELAALAGVRVQDVYDAKRNQHKALLATTSSRARVVACMQEHGISWEQVTMRTAVASAATTETAPATNVDNDLTKLPTEEELQEFRGIAPAPQEQGMALEDIIGELRRRLPGATVTISLQ